MCFVLVTFTKPAQHNIQRATGFQYLLAAKPFQESQLRILHSANKTFSPVDEFIQPKMTTSITDYCVQGVKRSQRPFEGGVRKMGVYHD